MQTLRKELACSTKRECEHFEYMYNQIKKEKEDLHESWSKRMLE